MSRFLTAALVALAGCIDRAGRLTPAYIQALSLHVRAPNQSACKHESPLTLRSLGSGGPSVSESEPSSRVSAACRPFSVREDPALLSSVSALAAPRLPKHRWRKMVT